MLTKRERFNNWRGMKVQDEQNHINSALLFHEYVSSVKELEMIKNDFSHIESEQFIAFNKYEKRSYGVLLHCKLAIEEVLDQLPLTGITERLLLTDLSTILGEVYDNPSNNPSQQLTNLINKTKQLLNIKPELLVDKKLARALCFDLYTFLSLVNLAINNLNWIQILAVKAVVNLDFAKTEITILLCMVEEKVKQLDKLFEDPPNIIEDAGRFIPDTVEGELNMEVEQLLMSSGNNDVVLDELSTEEPMQQNHKTLQEYFNEHYMGLLQTDDLQEQHLALLEEYLDEVREGFNRLITKRNKKEEIKLKIEKIQTLLNATEENDKLIHGRKYFSTLIRLHADSFNLLMEHCDELKKEQLARKVMQLNAPELYRDLSSKVLYSMSWATSWLAVAYRSCAPQIVQETIAAKVPTLDSECKAKLKDLARECISKLNQDYSLIDREIAKLNQQLSEENTELENLIACETTSNLTLFIKGNSATKAALHEYRRISEFLIGAVWHLNLIKESSGVLDKFVQTHDSFLVKLSNFLAQIFSFFKSDTAQMIDKALEMKKQLMHFESEYKNELANEWKAIELNPEIDKTLKARLREKIGVEMRRTTKIIPYTSPSKEEVRYLTRNLERLYNNNTQNGIAGNTDQIQEEELALSKEGQTLWP